MNQTTITSTTFGLRHKITGKLALLHAQDNDSGDYCGESRYTLNEDESWCERLYEAEDPRKAALALAINTPWYNSTAENPGWGTVDVTQYEVVEIVRTTAIRAIEVAQPLKFDPPVEQYNKTRSIVERYLGHPLPVPLVGDVVQMLVMPLPAGETVASLQAKCQDCDVLIGPDTQYPDRALGAFELPEEYADLLKGKPGFGLILTHEKR